MHVPGLARGLVLLGCWFGMAGAVHAQSVERGRALYETRCSACHSVEINRTGPLHAGVLGRRAGSVEGFTYSNALTASQLLWTRENLLAWLKDPEALIPGQLMFLNVPDERDREDVVSYLMTLKSDKPSSSPQNSNPKPENKQ